jgi:uracil-DNA glycosylase
MATDRAYALQDRGERERRRRDLQLPHVAPLTALVDHIRKRERLQEDVPYFDPRDGGVNARVLFLLKAPGPGAVESGFVSHNNPDPSAKNFLELLSEAGIPREETVTWNLVPWALRDRQGNVREVEPADEEDARPYLERLFALLPNLKVVVLMGESARSARKTVQALTRAHIIETYLTSARVINSAPDRRKKILTDLKRVAARLGG